MDEAPSWLLSDGLAPASFANQADELDIGPDLEPKDEPFSKRARIVHPHWESLGACDLCRKRRIKCIRLQAEDHTCEDCRKRKLACTNHRNGGLRYKPRAKRADKAKDKDGSVALVRTGSKFNSSAEGETPGSRSDSSSDSSSRPLALSINSVDGRLALSEESSGLLAHLVESYLASSTFSPPLVKWASLRDRFDRAGRRPRQLDPFTETLVLTLVAFGAFISDSPLILGNDAPRLEELDRDQSGTMDLSLWSQRRRGFCHKLVDQIVDLIDRRGIFRVSTTETVVTLTMCHELLNYCGREDQMHSFRTAAIHHIKRMHDEQSPVSDLAAGTQWNLAIADAFGSCLLGRMLTMSDEDVAELIAGPDFPRPKLENVQQALFSGDHDVYATRVGQFWLQFIYTTRDISRKIAAPLRRGRPVPFRLWLDSHEKIEAHFRLTISAHDLAKKLVHLAPPQVAHTQAVKFGDTAANHFCAMPLAVVWLLLVQYQKYKFWRTRRSAFKEVESNAEAEGAAGEDEVDALEMAMAGSVADALGFLARALREPGLKSVSYLTSHLSMFAVIQKGLEMAMRTSLELPTAEQGGPSQWTRWAKLDTCQTLVNAVRAQSWTWPQKLAAAQRGQATLDEMRLAFGTPPGEAQVGAEAAAATIDPTLVALLQANMPVQLGEPSVDIFDWQREMPVAASHSGLASSLAASAMATPMSAPMSAMNPPVSMSDFTWDLSSASKAPATSSFIACDEGGVSAAPNLASLFVGDREWEAILDAASSADFPAPTGRPFGFGDSFP